MAIAWRRRHATVRELHGELSESRAVAYTTVMTTMDRLFRKGLLSRSREGNAYRYSARFDHEHWTRKWSRAAIDHLLPSLDTASAAYFVEEARKANPELLAQLRKMIDEAGRV
jgi:predicted transcriptional regulator